MSWFSKKCGNTQTDISTVPATVPQESAKTVNWENRYKKIKKKHSRLINKHNKLTTSVGLVQEAVKALLDEQAVASFLLFSIAVKCGGRFELTPHDIEVAKKLEQGHTLDFVENAEGFTYAVKRKE